MSSLHGLRVFAVEDEPMLLLALQDQLADFGCEVVGTAARLEPALDLARDLSFDLAILDVNLAGRRVDTVAEAVAGRGLPVIFLTGYSGDFLGRPLQGPVVEKPYSTAELRQALMTALGVIE